MVDGKLAHDYAKQLEENNPSREEEDGFIYEEIQLPQALWDKIDKLAHYAGLTTSQMAQAIIILQFNAMGWFNNPKENG